MDVELSHHYGWERYSVDSNELGEAAYKAVRQSHEFLTDDNHHHTAGPRETTWGGNPIHWNSVVIYRGDGAPEYTGPESLRTDYWFAVEYREPKV